MKSPIVSVLMTSYNREKYIAQAIESVLSSTLNDFELIIVDDGSKDETVAIAKKYEAADKRVKVYLNKQNLGDYNNRNKAAEYATGKYIKYLDADDMIYYYSLEVIVNFIEQFPQAGFGLASKVSDDTPFPILLSPVETYREHFNGYSHFDRAPGSSIINLEAFRKVGGFSGKRMIGDYEFWFKIARNYPMVKYPLDLYFNRLHEGQESQSDYAKLYPKLRKEVLQEALSHADCPLSEAEIKAVRKMTKKTEMKESVLVTLSRIKRSILNN